MIRTKAEILVNQEIAPGHFKVVLKLEDFSEPIRAGQFFHIRAGSDYDPLLRRPISVHRTGPTPDIVEILYKVVGKCTRLMSRRSKNTYLDAIGPLGNGFKVPKSQSNFILIAGGMGVAPLVGLCEELAKFRKRSITVIIGAKTKDCVTCKREFKDLGAEVIVVTDDGSEGEKGVSTDMLEPILKQFDLRKDGSSPYTTKDTAQITIGDYCPEVGIYACGPTAMLKAVAKIAKYHRIQTQASLEERMGCGIGACLGCVVKTRTGYKRVCKDGPVFDLEDLIW